MKAQAYWRSKEASGGNGTAKSNGGSVIDYPNALWKEYKRTSRLDLRNILMERYLSLVDFIASRVKAKLPEFVDVLDLYSMGIFGLIDAIEGFDPDRGVKFEIYSTTRIWGAMMDGLRQEDWVPRILRSKANKIRQAFYDLVGILGRPPSDVEMADELHISLEAYKELLWEQQVSTYSIFRILKMGIL